MSEEKRFDGHRVRFLTRLAKLAARAYDAAQGAQGKPSNIAGIADELADAVDGMIPKQNLESEASNPT